MSSGVKEELFCYLEKDQKTFDYVKKHVELIENGASERDIFALGNLIQVEEMGNHLKRKGIPENDIEANVSEAVSWIKENGKGFRIYLNTIKVASMIFYSRDSDCPSVCSYKEFTFENFCKVVDDLNRIKICMFDEIF